MEISKFKVMF